MCPSLPRRDYIPGDSEGPGPLGLQAPFSLRQHSPGHALNRSGPAGRVFAIPRDGPSPAVEEAGGGWGSTGQAGGNGLEGRRRTLPAEGQRPSGNSGF